MGRSRSLPAWQTDDAAIVRALRTDSETLRYAEWWVRKRLYGLSDQEARWLVEQMLAARKSIIAGWAESDFTLRQREALMRQIDGEIERLFAGITDHVAQSELDALRQGYYGRAWALDVATRPDINIRAPLLPTEAIRAMTLTPYAGVNWMDDLGFTRDEYVARIKRALVTSLVNGESVQKAAQRLNSELGVRPGQRDAFKGMTYKTLLITRNEILRASNLGALSVYEQNPDILDGWEFVSARDERVCKLCGALDGKVFKFGDPQMVPPSGSHPGCRCTAVGHLIDAALMDRLTDGPRQTYRDWARENGIDVVDGGLGAQRASDAGKVNAA